MEHPIFPRSFMHNYNVMLIDKIVSKKHSDMGYETYRYPQITHVIIVEFGMFCIISIHMWSRPTVSFWTTVYNDYMLFLNAYVYPDTSMHIYV